MPDMKSEPYPWTYHVLLTRSGTLPCSPNSLPMVSKAISIHHSWLADFLSCRSQRVALNGVPSSPLPVQAGVPPGGVLSPVFFWFSSMISPTPWKILFISFLMTPPSAVTSVISQTSKHQLLRSLQIWIKSHWSNMWNMPCNPDKSHTLTVSLRKDHLGPPPPPSTFSTIL